MCVGLVDAIAVTAAPSTLHLAASSVADQHLQASAIAGGLAKLARDSALHPLDTLKTRSQIPTKRLRQAAEHGSVYAGVIPTLLFSIPAGATYFGLNSAAKDLLEANLACNEGSAKACAAAVAALGFWFVRTPAELLKTRAMTEADGMEPFLRGDMRRISALLGEEGGARALWTGYGVTAIRSVPFEVLRLSMYPVLLSSLASMSLVDGMGGALAGFAASALAALLTQPLDTIKTTLQLAPSPAYEPGRSKRPAEARFCADTAASDHRESGAATQCARLWRISGAIQLVVEGEGALALFRGARYRAVNAGLAGGVTFGTYQLVLPWAERLLTNLS